VIDSTAKENIKRNFEIASEEFDFCFVSPHYIGGNNEFGFFGYLFRDSLEKGVVIDLLEEDDEDNLRARKIKYCKEQGRFYSRIAGELFSGE